MDDRHTAALLGIYLNDHLAGATGGVELARRAAKADRGSPVGTAVQRLAGELEADRTALLQIMHTLRVPVRRYKVYAAWAGEKVGRLKLNGRVLRRSPLSTVVELEALRLVVEGNAALWRALLRLAERDPRLDADRLDLLLAGNRRQAEELADLSVGVAAEVLSDGR